MSSSTITHEDRLAIRFEPDTIPSTSTSQSQVQQIIAQRGAFRNISEKSLQAEIGQSETDGRDAQVQSNDEDSSEDETFQSRQEKLWKHREEMLHKLSYAQNEVLSALDFISLVLSSNSKGAQASMSPALRAIVQPGTLDGRVVERKQLSAKTKTSLTKVSEGWKSDSFKSAANKLQECSRSLAGEAQHQAKYWEQIARLKMKGWPISRLPSDSRALGVHFGFPESAPHFRNRGFALIQQSESGDIGFDSRSLPKKAQSIRFEVLRGGQQTGSFMSSVKLKQENSDTNTDLLHARNSLFEEELFYELNREARLIANQGIQIQAGFINVDVGGEYTIRISQSSIADHNTNNISDSDNSIAHFVAMSSRLLLTSEHQRSRDKRSQPPAPMSLTAPVVPECAILRPIIARLRHQVATKRILQLFQEITACFRKAGLTIEVGSETEQSPEGMNATDVKLGALRGIARTTVRLKLSSDKDLALHLNTYLGSPLYGTGYESASIDFGFVKLPASSIRNFIEAKNFLMHVTLLELVAYVWESVKSSDKAKDLEWTLTRPHSGEFVISQTSRSIAKVNVSIETGRIALHTIFMTAASALPKKSIHVWTGKGHQSLPADGDNTNVDRTLIDVLVELNKYFAGI